ncbi:hypothetical protein [Hydrogenophaga sp.]|uniref:hypothetical protein n=1 Tax=Hydrogenophaga sp. TaxID=1904254 RepID=UPI002727BB33|nr:hypothetical protein [Hydrogenophaga sp.]MDO9507630.1 hypothetical protein [Hydrogenophaga sp.]
MFEDNHAYAELVNSQMKATTEFLGMTIAIMNDSAVEKLGQHMAQGAQLTVTVTAPPAIGGPTTLELALVHPTAGRLLLHSASTASGVNTTPANPGTTH